MSKLTYNASWTAIVRKDAILACSRVDSALSTVSSRCLSSCNSAPQDSRPAFSELAAKLERGVEKVNAGAADQLEERIITPMGERVVRNLLLTQLGHVPYHYGQIKMTAKQLE